MIYIFHGEDLAKSRTALNSLIAKLSTTNILRLNTKQTSLENVNLFLNSSSLFIEPKLLILENFFSLSKPILDKVIPVLEQNKADNIVLYQDKNLTVNQQKLFPSATVEAFKASSLLWACLNSLRPGNITKFLSLYEQMLTKEPYDLFLYLLKASLRKNLLANYPLPQSIAQKIYLQLIELDYQNKTGKLSIPKELALQRIIISSLSANIS